MVICKKFPYRVLSGECLVLQSKQWNFKQWQNRSWETSQGGSGDMNICLLLLDFKSLFGSVWMRYNVEYSGCLACLTRYNIHSRGFSPRGEQAWKGYKESELLVADSPPKVVKHLHARNAGCRWWDTLSDEQSNRISNQLFGNLQSHFEEVENYKRFVLTKSTNETFLFWPFARFRFQLSLTDVKWYSQKSTKAQNMPYDMCLNLIISNFRSTKRILDIEIKISNNRFMSVCFVAVVWWNLVWRLFHV